MANDAAAALDDREVRRIVNDFSVAKAEGPYADHIRRLAARWHEFNVRHFGGQLSPAYISVSEPKSPRAEGSCSEYSGHGGRLQILIRPSHVAGTVNQSKKPAPGKTVRFMKPGHKLEYRHRHLDDILLHEMGHQFEMEALGLPGGHGKEFTALCNRIGAELGLPPVVIRRRKGDPKSVPICSAWPSNVRPEGYYGDLWAETKADAEEDEDPVVRWIAAFAAFSDRDKRRGLMHPVVAVEWMILAQADEPEAATNGGIQAEPESPKPVTLKRGKRGATPARVRTARLARGWSQTQLATAVGVGQAVISRLEAGRFSPATMASVAEVLEL